MTRRLQLPARWAKPLFVLSSASLYLMLGLLAVGLFALEMGSTVFFIGIAFLLAAVYLLTLLVRRQFKEMRPTPSQTLPPDGLSTPAVKTRTPFRLAAGLLAMSAFAVGVMVAIAVVREWPQLRSEGGAGWLLGLMVMVFVFAAVMDYGALPGKEWPRQTARQDSRQ